MLAWMLFGGNGVFEGGRAVKVGVIGVGEGVGLGDKIGVAAIIVAVTTLEGVVVSLGRGESRAGDLPHPTSSTIPKSIPQNTP